jgi:hypothetical protein
VRPFDAGPTRPPAAFYSAPSPSPCVPLLRFPTLPSNPANLVKCLGGRQVGWRMIGCASRFSHFLDRKTWLLLALDARWRTGGTIEGAGFAQRESEGDIIDVNLYANPCGPNSTLIGTPACQDRRSEGMLCRSPLS